MTKEDGLLDIVAVDQEAGTITLAEPPTQPTAEQALERLRGRRAQAIEQAAHVRTVVETKGQNRHTRRNNLRLARIEARKRVAPDPAWVTNLIDAAEPTMFPDTVERPRLADQRVDPAKAAALAKFCTDELRARGHDVTVSIETGEP